MGIIIGMSLSFPGIRVPYDYTIFKVYIHEEWIGARDCLAFSTMAVLPTQYAYLSRHDGRSEQFVLLIYMVNSRPPV